MFINNNASPNIIHPIYYRVYYCSLSENVLEETNICSKINCDCGTGYNYDMRTYVKPLGYCLFC